MANLDVAYTVESEQQFWNELNDIVAAPCGSYELIDEVLRSWLYLVAAVRDQYLASEDDIASCSQMLVESPIFCANREYVRTQIMYSLLQEDDFGPLHVIANFLLLDGRSDEAVFRRMIEEGCFCRLLELVRGCRDEDRRLHRLLLELMYEMSRIEHLRVEDLMQVDDSFVAYLFQLIENLSDDMEDPYHYPVIRVLLVLNEQYMVASTLAAVAPTGFSTPPTNRVVKILSLCGPRFRTFGENIILLLNRETETSLQLLILKLLYLLFTTKATYEYFYTNDLRVLLDVIIRNLLDLPNELISLRHTYLRVLYPLLAHTQLCHPPHYKREEILRVLQILRGSGSAHFAPADDTTLRLVDRVAKVTWLIDEAELGEGEVARKLLGISLSRTDTASSVSVLDVVAVSEKPGVKTPSRKMQFEEELPVGIDDNTLWTSRDSLPGQETKPAVEPVQATRPKKALPELPKHRHGMLTAVPLAKCPVATTKGASGPHKRIPPQLPPPRRRTKLKPNMPGAEALTTVEQMQATADSTAV